jgi:predicted acetyltransferase
VEIRNIKDDERAAFVLLARYAFHDWTDDEVGAARLAWARPENVWGVFVDGAMASALMCFNAEQNVRGVVKAMGGVACVATSPPYRGRGYVHGLMRAAFEDMRRRGTAVSMLRPFRESFYRGFRYVTANSTMRVAFPTEALAKWLGCEPPPGWAVTASPAREAWSSIRDFWREEALRRYHGLIYLPEATEGEWLQWVKDKVVSFADFNGDVRGLALFKKTGYGHHGKLEVSQFLWADAEARDLLLQLLARHRDQVGEIEIRMPYGAAFQQWLEDVPRPLRVEVLHFPWMVRVMDVAEALEGLPAAEPGEVAVDVVDEQCEWNSGWYTLRAVDGRIRVAKGEGPGDLRMDIRALSALTYGTLPPAELERRGWLAGGDAASRELLAAWFPPEFIFNTFDF